MTIKKNILIAASVGLMAVSCSAEQTTSVSAPKAEKNYSESVSAEKNIPREIVTEITVAKPVSAVFQDWTTAEGQQAFFGEKVILERRTNGLHEVHFLPDAEPGGRGHEDGRILGWQENRMFSFTWTMPPYMPEIRPHHTHVQMWFDDLGAEGTRIRLYHDGFGDGAAWDQGFEYFTEVWPNVLVGYKTYTEQQ